VAHVICPQFSGAIAALRSYLVAGGEAVAVGVPGHRKAVVEVPLQGGRHLCGGRHLVQVVVDAV
jgi:urease beta subunit